MLAVRVGAVEHPAVEERGTVGELALGTADTNVPPREAVEVVLREAVDRVPLGHGVVPPGRHDRAAGTDPAAHGCGCEAGLSPAAGGGPGSGELAGGLVRGEHLDPAGVTFLTRVRGTEEDLDELRRLLEGVHPPADRHDVGVVVLTAESGGLLAPGERGTHALDLVGGDLLAVARAADHDAEAALVRGRPLRGTQAERRVVVLGVVDVGTAVHGLVAMGLEPLDEVVLEFEAGMVRAEVHAHGSSVACGAGAVRRGAGLGARRSDECNETESTLPYSHVLGSNSEVRNPSGTKT